VFRHAMIRLVLPCSDVLRSDWYCLVQTCYDKIGIAVFRHLHRADIQPRQQGLAIRERGREGRDDSPAPVTARETETQTVPTGTRKHIGDLT